MDIGKVSCVFFKNFVQKKSTHVWTIVSAMDPESLSGNSAIQAYGTSTGLELHHLELIASLQICLGKRILERLQEAIKCLGMRMTRILSAHTHWSERVTWLQSSTRSLGIRTWCTFSCLLHTCSDFATGSGSSAMRTPIPPNSLPTGCLFSIT